MHRQVMAGTDRSRMAGAVRFALAAIVLATSTQADTASRARIEPAAVALSAPEARACWARYSAASGQARGGVIEEVAFRVPCPEAMGRGFIETLQRALMARGYHEGPVTGVADAQTRAAVQAFQRAGGFNSPILTLETAQRLGLVPIELTRN